MRSSVVHPAGYSSTVLQLKTVILSVADWPAVKIPSSWDAGEMKSKDAFTAETPAGTSTWNVHPSSRSRRHFNVCPLAVNFSPAKSWIGPVGPCSPGIHLG